MSEEPIEAVKTISADNEEPKEEDEPRAVDSQSLSKKQLKRLRKAEEWEKKKVLINNKKKEQRALKRAAAAAKRAAEGSDVAQGPSDDVREKRHSNKKQDKELFINNCHKNCGLLIDCAWEDIHNDRCMTSLGQQLSFSYGANRRAATPSLLYFTGVGPRLNKLLTKNQAYSWLGVHVSEHDFLEDPNIKELTDSDKKLVYLTSEADEVLTTIDKDCIYIIGGIVDRNSHKGITHKKAQEKNIKCAKLPIREYADIHSSTVLTVNHVVEIMLKYNETKSWDAAINGTVPNRKRNLTTDEAKEVDGADEPQNKIFKLENDTDNNSVSNS